MLYRTVLRGYQTKHMVQLQHTLSAQCTARHRCRLLSVSCRSMAEGAAAVHHKASKKVAVIGAGAAGLASIKELLKEGHKVVAFEQGPAPGGTWVYDTSTDSDVLGAAAGRRRVHGSMYRDLRTNLPRELMSYTDVPFTPAMMGPASHDPRRFPSHTEVLAYLCRFAELHQLHSHILFNTQVLSATPLLGSSPETLSNSSNDAVNNSSSTGAANGSIGTSNGGASSSSRSSNLGPRWRVESLRLGDDGQPIGQPEQQVFDALVVCNGHYSEPNLPDVPGADSCPGLQMHSHNYRVPEAFAGQVVVVVGASNSGEDVYKEVSSAAAQVVVAARSWRNPEWASDPRPFGPRCNVSRRGMISALHPDGRVEFTQGPPLERADTIIYCTGYRYKFPFLEHHPSTIHLSGQQYVPGLYQHMFVPSLGPSLSFVGLPWKIVPFPQFELQSKLIARLLSGQAQLPGVAEMEADVARHYEGLKQRGQPLRYCHMMDQLQWAYNDWLVEAAGPGVAPLSPWRPAMYAANRTNKLTHPDDYRDRWDDVESAAAAEQEMKLLQQKLQQAGLDAAAVPQPCSML